MKIGIVIINWNGLNLLKKYLRPIIENSLNSKVYVIDNNSSDESLLYLSENFKEVEIISLDKNYGFAEGYNLGLKKVEEEYVCIINNDILVTKDWLSPIREKFKKYPSSIIQPNILDINNSEFFEYAGASGGFIDKYGYPFCRGRIFNTIEKNDGQYSDSKIFWASGACFFISKKIFYEIGGFDKRFFAHMEEIDLCWRAFNLGFSCYSITSSKVFHVGAATIKKNSKKTYLNYRNSLIMMTKNLPLKHLLSTLFLRLVLDIVSSVKLLIQGEVSHFIAVYKAHINYFYKLKSILRERNNSSKKANYFKINSIVYKYFILGRKKFFQL
ncbi:MAG: glycosyltransferase family 2 protein [Flavobacteriaceae bacterium]|nr:glycosyltransferase family 2 protein [Flavobacteriaceae bacterium]